MKLHQCLGANRPLIFVVAESDLEVLLYLRDKYKKGSYHVYSTTFSGVYELTTLLDESFSSASKGAAQTTIQVLDSILKQTFDSKRQHTFKTYVFLDCQNYIRDPQNIRKIKDILSRYQLDENFTCNMVFISQTLCIPPDLDRLSEIVFFDLPDENELKEHSDHISSKLELSKIGKAPSEEVVNNLKGLTRFEVEQAYLQSFFMYKGIELGFIRDFKKASIAKTDLLTLLETDLTFNDIGGMPQLKAWIEKSAGGWTVEGRAFGLPLLKGLLLVGLSGCGKSMICKAIGNQWGLPVIQLDLGRLFSIRVGESEANLRRMLKIVENISPCVLMIDEIEKGFAGIHSSTYSDGGVTARVIGSFLIWLQDCNHSVFTVATSNNIENLPPELISRFDETFFVGLPQFQERKDIFSIHLRKLKKDTSKFFLDQLASSSEDLSGREIEQVLKESMYDAFHAGKELDTETVLRVLRNKTNLVTTMAEQLNYLLKWVGWDDDKQDGLRARFASKTESSDVSRIRDQIDKLINDVQGGVDEQI